MSSDFWNARYATEDYIFGTAPNVFLASQIALIHPGMQALAVADGEGRNGVWLARQGFKVQAFDVADVAVAKARRLAAEAGVEVTAVRLRNVRTATPSPDMFIEEGDVVVLLGTEAGVAAAEIRLLQG